VQSLINIAYLQSFIVKPRTACTILVYFVTGQLSQYTQACAMLQAQNTGLVEVRDMLDQRLNETAGNTLFNRNIRCLLELERDCRWPCANFFIVMRKLGRRITGTPA
jgi:hypothetical protein